MRSIEFKGDIAGDYRAQNVATRKTSFLAQNKIKQEIYFSIFLEDQVTGKVFECDPAVRNDPQV